MKITKLFSPLKINGITLKNRAAMAPMSTDFSNDDGSVGDKMINYYTARAKGGVGLIFFEVVTVDSMLPYMPRTAGVWNEELIAAMKRLTDSVHNYGTKIFPQLTHPGPESLCSMLYQTETVGPTAGCVNNVSKARCRELKIEEIPEIIEKFKQSAINCKNAGFDGIELHAAHNYMLLGSFMSALRNRRTDMYGGSLENRLRLSIEVIKAIRSVVGKEYPITMRISGDEFSEGGRDIRETQLMVKLLEEAGIDGFHVSNGVYPNLSWHIIPPTGTPLGLNTFYAKKIKEVVKVPVFVVGRINEPLMAEDILQNNDADGVVMGRALIADPEFVNKVASNRFDDIRPCIGCGLGCIVEREKGNDMTCIFNPEVGKEGTMPIAPASKKKHIMVVGGGPGGLEAARIAALRGHDVTLYEKNNWLGGQYYLATKAPHKSELTKAIQYMIVQAKKAGVKIQINTEVTPNFISGLPQKPDVVIIATGALSICPSIKCIDGPNVVSALEVLAGAVTVDPGNVLIIGGGMVGLEMAELLADRGDNLTIGATNVTIVEMLENVGTGIATESRVLLMETLRQKGVQFILKTKVLEFFDDGALILRNGKEEVIHGMDKIILAMGTKAFDPLSIALKGVISEVYVIGDAKKSRQVLQAIAEGQEIGMKL